MKIDKAVELLKEFKSSGISWIVEGGIIKFSGLKTSQIMKLVVFTNEQLITASEKLK